MNKINSHNEILRHIFPKEDFTLCNVPVPIGYPQSQTHCGIAKWHNQYFLTTSPYPNFQENYFVVLFKTIMRKITKGRVFKSVRAEAFENPCVYYGLLNLDVPPTCFSLMKEGILMGTPDEYYDLPSFNSDPDIFIDDGTIYVLNRSVYRQKLGYGAQLGKYEIRLYIISGQIDNNRFKLDRIERLLSTEERMIVSPCLTNYKGRYILFELETNAYNDGESFHGLFFYETRTINELKNCEQWQQVKVNNNNYLPWHMSVFQHDGHLYSIIACIKKGEKHRCLQMFGEFNEDLTELKIYKTPLTDYKSYRGSALVDANGMFVLYSTTVHENIKGSKAVDGRDVIMAKMPFDQLLDKIRKNENE